MDIFILDKSKNIINTFVTSLKTNKWFRIYFVYGPPSDTGRKEFWRLLNDTASSIVGAWLCVGDFNELISNEEAIGGVMRDERRIMLFRNFIFSARLIDIGSNGP